MSDAAIVYLVVGSDEEHGWVEAVFTDKSRAETLARDLQDETDSPLDLYRVEEVHVQ